MKPLAERLSDRKLISRGDISSAFRAHDTRLDRDVFLKILHPHFAEDTDLRTRFEREARAAAKIDHPQLVRIYEVGEDPQEGPFMLLEWVEGETLAAKIKREGKLAPAKVRQLASALLNALSALHQNRILHRDVKPDNILCRNDGEFKLTDFSLALLADAPKLTHHTAVVGTPAYLAPELARGKSPSERSDLFAVGVVLFEAATGHNPFYADALLESLRRVREEEPDWTLLESFEQDPSLIQLIKSCLEKEAEARPDSAANAASFLTGTSHETLASNTSNKKRGVIAAAFFLFIIGSVVLWPQFNKSDKPQTSSPQASLDTLNHDKEEVIPQLTIPQIADDSTAPQEVELAEKPLETTATTNNEPTLSKIIAPPDSIELFLDTDPWAHVTLEGNDLGTTPLGKPLRLSAGQHIFMLRNPAYPPIQAKLDLVENSRRAIALSDFVQHIELIVEPWGDVYLDNELIGTSPLNKFLVVLPGSHSLRVTHPVLPPVEKTWQAIAGDTLRLRANLETSELAVRTWGESH